MAWTWNPLLVRWGSICLRNSRFAHGKIARAPRQQQHVANIFLQRDDGLLARSESARFDSKYFSRIERFEEPSGGDFQHDLDEHFLTFLCFVFLLGRDHFGEDFKMFRDQRTKWNARKASILRIACWSSIDKIRVVTPIVSKPDVFFPSKSLFLARRKKSLSQYLSFVMAGEKYGITKT